MLNPHHSAGRHPTEWGLGEIQYFSCVLSCSESPTSPQLRHPIPWALYVVSGALTWRGSSGT